jgi:hypothetical protein
VPFFFSGPPLPFLFLVAQEVLPAIAGSDMDVQIKVRKARVRKQDSPQIASLKKSVSAALKAAWNVDALKVRQEKAVRAGRASLAGKVQLQVEALEKVKVAVDAFLGVLKGASAELAPVTPVVADLEAGTLASTFCDAEPVLEASVQ